MRIVNLDIAAHPMNWVIVFLMVFIGGIALHLVLNNLPKVKVQQQS